MAGGIDWFRWHHGAVTDPKFQLAARKAGASLPDVLAVWAYILEQASASTDRGTFGEIDAEALDCLFGFPATETRTADILAAMDARGLISDGRIVAWEKRQPKREREDDTAADRKRRQRGREVAESSESHATPAHVTPCHATSHQKTPRGEESREDKEQKPKQERGSPSGSRLPADWCPSADDLAFAANERPDVDVVAEAAKFADYWHGLPGAKGRKSDWPATWRNWIRRADAPRGNARAGPPQAAPASRTLTAIQTLQGMKSHGTVDPQRDSGRTEQAALPGT